MTPGLGRGLGVGPGVIVGTGTETRTGTGRGLGRHGAALADAVATSVAPPPPEAGEPALDEDDAPPEEAYGDWAPEDDDEPWVGDEAASDAPPRRRFAGPEILIWPDGPDAARIQVREPDDAQLLDPHLGPLVVARHRRLISYAEYLAERHAAVLGRPTLLRVYEGLEILSGQDVAHALAQRRDTGAVVTKRKVNSLASQWSRDAEVLVALPAGTVPLGFFTWRKAADDVVVFLGGQADLLTAATADLARRAARACGGTSGGVEPYVNWARAVVAFPHITSTFRARLHARPQDGDALIDDFARALDHALQAAARDPGDLRRWRLKVVARDVYNEITEHRGTPVLVRAMLGGLV